MREIIVTTTLFEQNGREAIGEAIIKELVPNVMRYNDGVNPDTIGRIVEWWIDRFKPKRVKCRLGYEDGRFYYLDKNSKKILMALSIRA